MAFHIFPTDADFDELYPAGAAKRRARKERESKGVGRVLAIIGRLLVIGFCGLIVFAEIDRGPTIGDGLQRVLNGPLGIMAVLILPYFLFMWRVELFIRRRLRRIRANIKTAFSDDQPDGAPDLPPQPRRTTPPERRRRRAPSADSMRN